MGHWQISPLPSKNYCGQPQASQDLSPRWNGKRGSRLFIPASRLSLAIKFCVWKAFSLHSILPQKKKESRRVGEKEWEGGTEQRSRFVFIYSSYSKKSISLPGFEWMQNPPQHLQERERSQLVQGVREGNMGGRRELNLSNGVRTSLEFELQNLAHFKF